MKAQNKTKMRTHDAIVGILYLISAALAFTLNIQWLYIAVAVAALQIISPVTKFCPVYFILNKLMPESDPIHDGSRN
jgi:4-hydroxybenzoate polyprenyltransferase